MIMSDADIRQAVADGDLVIEQFREDCLQGASYDCRVGRPVQLMREDSPLDLEQTRTVRLEAGEFALLMTRERFKLSNRIAANIGGKTYFTRKGLVLLAGLQIDPTYEGHLALAVYNSSPKHIAIEYEQPICTVQFLRLSSPVERPFRPFPGMEELREGRLPRVDREYFRDLEAESLTVLGRDLRQLAVTVSQLSTDLKGLRDAVERDTASIRMTVEHMSKLFFYALLPVVITLGISTVAALVTALLSGK